MPSLGKIHVFVSSIKPPCLDIIRNMYMCPWGQGHMATLCCHPEHYSTPRLIFTRCFVLLQMPAYLKNQRPNRRGISYKSNCLGILSGIKRPKQMSVGLPLPLGQPVFFIQTDPSKSDPPIRVEAISSYKPIDNLGVHGELVAQVGV